MPQTFLFLLFLALLTGIVYVLWTSRVRARKRALHVQKLYASQLYLDLKPTLSWLRNHSPEELSVDKTGLTIRMMNEENESAFLMRANGYRYLTPAQQDAMRVVLEERLPNLRDHNRYSLTRRRVRLLNGEVEYAYCYIITHSFKAQLARARYFSAEEAQA